MNEYHDNWLNLIYERDQFYLYLAAAVFTGWLVYRWLRLWRFFKAVLALLFVAAVLGVIWGIYQLPTV